MREFSKRMSMLVAMLLTLASVSESSAQPTTKGRVTEWPQFLGSQRNGLSPETGLLDKWPAAGPKVVWRVPGGVGMSGIALQDGRAITLVQRDGQQILVALDASSGKTAWQTQLAPAYRNAMGDGPRGTPTISNGRVFAYTGEGILAAVDFKSGELIWSKNVMEELGGAAAEYGTACSPLVVGTRVIVAVGAPGPTFAGFNVVNGLHAWSVGGDPSGYSSPALLSVAGQTQVVAFSGASVMGINPATGKQLWRHPYETSFNCNIAVPLLVDGRILISAGENHGSELLDVKPSADGKFAVSSVWSSQGPKSVLRSEWQTPLLIGGNLYGMDNVGGAGPITHLTCVEAATGKQLWQVPRFGKGNLIAADGKIFMTTMKGELVVARASPKAYEEIGRMPVLETTRQAPSLAGGLLYMRDDKDIVCVDVRATP